MMNQVSILRSDGSTALGELNPHGESWNFNFLSRGSQVNNELEELIVPDEIIRFNDTVSFFLDTILQYIEQTDMYNENALGVDAGFTIRDAVVVSAPSSQSCLISG